MARNGDTRRGGDTGTHIITKTRPKTKRPSLYKVLLLNDDYTPMDFVVYVLARFFNKPREETARIMLHVLGPASRHGDRDRRDDGAAGSLALHARARQHEHPL